jgi:Flp pilus assembly protein TadG
MGLAQDLVTGLTRKSASSMERKPPFLARLATDVRGNILAMSAIAFFPLLGILGGALDMSRVYLTKSRLQQACDAAVLAGRKTMVGSTWTSSNAATALSFFNTNFTPGRYGSQNAAINFNVGNDMIVHGTATANVPTTMMRIFHPQPIPLTITCDAQLQLPNTDVMFVLDTTLSMADTNPGDAASKIASLRAAVTNFYNTLQNAKAPGTQVRYGFVPYSSTVNVGMLLKRDWMVDKWTYQSREPNGTPQQTQGGTQGATLSSSSSTYTGTIGTFKTFGPSENCVAPANTRTQSTQSGAWSPSSTALPRTKVDVTTYNGSTYATSRDSNNACVITETRYTNYVQTTTTTVTENPNAGQQNAGGWAFYWNYKPIEYDVSPLKGNVGNGLMAGGSITAPLNTSTSGGVGQFTNATVTWNSSNACIEERKTLRSGETGTAYDLDVDFVPQTSDDNTRWRPFLPRVVYARKQTSYTNPPAASWSVPAVNNTTAGYINLASYTTDHAACPTASRKLDANLTASQLTTYLNSLKPAGQTYHDIGFLWGLRLISAEGLFSSENSAAPNGGNIARHIIFMTDGNTQTDISDYDAYGLSALDRRRTDLSTLPTNSQQDTIVENRLTQLCNVAKNNKNITVWVIAFGTNLTSLLSNCASPNRAYQANNSAELNATFAEIASQISQLRLTR